MIKKMKEKGYLSKSIVIPAVVFVCLVIFTSWALWDAKRVNPIEEDGKTAIKDIEKDEKESRREIKDVVGKEFPTQEEVERFVKTIPEDEFPNTIIDKEFGKEVRKMYYKNQLVSKDDDAETRHIKESALKRDISKDGIGTSSDLLMGEVFIPTLPYSTLTPGFKEAGQYNVGYIRTAMRSWDETGNPVRDDGHISMYVYLSVYAMEELSAKEFQQGINTLGVTVDGVQAYPAMELDRKEGNTEINTPYGSYDLESKNYKNVSSLAIAEDWENVKFDKAVIYPGTVVQVAFEVPMQEVYKELDYDAGKMEFKGQPKELTVTVGKTPFTINKVNGGETDVEYRR